jgi:hypothetical protein
VVRVDRGRQRRRERGGFELGDEVRRCEMKERRGRGGGGEEGKTANDDGCAQS